ncbi:MAG: outer membrane protein assembly factor [Lysobacteraceae bacterium]|nr:MAG: outer membrane protein assembly factor [Xanthomonadaceae bacterium]
MSVQRRAAIAAAVLFAFCGNAQAAKIARVQIVGLDEAMTANVIESLSLEDGKGKDVSDARLDYLLRAAEDETREALEPFGYYSPRITISAQRDETGVAIRIEVAPGEPVRVRSATVAIEGDGADDRYLKEEIAAFTPKPGDVFDHAVYEQSKAYITRRLAERGYFDADFIARKVEVNRAEGGADIDLRWDSGDRYDMGAITFEQGGKPAIRESLLRELIYWNEGEYYHQGRLDRLRKALAEMDYFSRIDIEPQPERAVDGRVPVIVRLTPAKRSVYSAGFSYGTDSGFGLRLGLERRYLNSRGHKALAQLDDTEKRKTLTLQHRIPAFAWRDGWYTTSLQAYDEQTDYIDTRRYEAVFSRSAEYDRNLNLTGSVHALRERWAYAYEDDADPDTPVLYRQATYLYPSLQLEYVKADDRIHPRNGVGASAVLRVGVRGAGSDANFLQLHGHGSWFRGLGARSRLIARGELGLTFTDDLVEIPPTLRFYAGGDRSVRGYDWREIGPRVDAAPGRKAFALGARNVITTNLEFEQYFNASWGMAAFVDGGSAFDGKLDRWRNGVGVGLRWKSPVGPLRVDLARGLDDPDASFTLHVNLGADL